MRLVACLLLVSSTAVAQPLPKKCAADSPTDAPCRSIKGRYKIELAPRDKSCVVTKRVSAILDVKSDGKKPAFDARALANAIGLRRGHPPELTADIRDGVCCLDLRLYGLAGAKDQRVMVHMAAGAIAVSAKADDRWIAGSKMCGDEDLDVSVTRTR
jgi:hypothetical protein